MYAVYRPPGRFSVAIELVVQTWESGFSRPRRGTKPEYVITPKELDGFGFRLSNSQSARVGYVSAGDIGLRRVPNCARLLHMFGYCIIGDAFSHGVAICI